MKVAFSLSRQPLQASREGIEMTGVIIVKLYSAASELDSATPHWVQS
jgi:hypothetical protein